MIALTNELKQGTWKDRIEFAVSLALLFLLAFLFLFPFYWMVKGALQPSSMALQIPPSFAPVRLSLDNFHRLFTRTLALRWLANSIIVAGSATLLTLLTASLSGYAFAKKRFPGRELIFWLLLTAMMVPKQVMLVPLYVLMNRYGLYNTHAGMFLPMVAWPFGLFLFRQFMQGIPNALIDSARMDGAGEALTFRRIIAPMSKPAFATVGILYFINTWNDYMWQLVMAKDLLVSTLPVGVSRVSRTEFEVDYGLLMAGATFGAVLVAAAFLFFQKYFVRGLTMGAVKG
jgi:multiple sugar transport system permease protein